MKLTINKLKELKACRDGIKFVKSLNTDCFETIFNEGLKADRGDDLKWLLPRLMTKEQKISYAIFAVEQVIDVFESENTEDKKPRKAINSAKEFLKDPSEENRQKCKNIYSANYFKNVDYSKGVSYFAAAAASAAYSVSYATSHFALHTAVFEGTRHAVSVVYAAAYFTEKKETCTKILKFGFELLTKGEK